MHAFGENYSQQSQPEAAQETQQDDGFSTRARRRRRHLRRFHDSVGKTAVALFHSMSQRGLLLLRQQDFVTGPRDCCIAHPLRNRGLETGRSVDAVFVILQLAHQSIALTAVVA